MNLAAMLVAVSLFGVAAAQVERAPFEAAWVALPSNTSIVATGDFDADGDVDAIGWYWHDSN